MNAAKKDALLFIIYYILFFIFSILFVIWAAILFFVPRDAEIFLITKYFLHLVPFFACIGTAISAYQARNRIKNNISLDIVFEWEHFEKIKKIYHFFGIISFIFLVISGFLDISKTSFVQDNCLTKSIIIFSIGLISVIITLISYFIIELKSVKLLKEQFNKKDSLKI